MMMRIMTMMRMPAQKGEEGSTDAPFNFSPSTSALSDLIRASDMHHAYVPQSSPSSVLPFPTLTPVSTRCFHQHGKADQAAAHCAPLHHFIALLAFCVVVLHLSLAAAFLGFFLAAALLGLGAPQILVPVARLQSSSDQFMPMMQSAMKSVKHHKFCEDGVESNTDKVFLSGHPESTQAIEKTNNAENLILTCICIILTSNRQELWEHSFHCGLASACMSSACRETRVN